MSDVFRALADPTRREIILMLARRPENVNTLAERFAMSRPAVSKHLRVLADHQLITLRSDGEDRRQRRCYFEPAAREEMTNYLAQVEKFWSSKLDRLDDFLRESEEE